MNQALLQIFVMITVPHGSYFSILNRSFQLAKCDVRAIFGNCDYFPQRKLLRRSI